MEKVNTEESHLTHVDLFNKVQMVRYILKQRQRNNNGNGKHSVQSKIVKENITTFHNICTIVLVYFYLFKFCKGLHVDLCIFINFIVSLFSTLF